MVELVEKLAGPRPEVPKEIIAPSWTDQANQVLKERYLLKDQDGKAVETMEEMCWRVAWELAMAEVKFAKGRVEVIEQAKDIETSQQALAEEKKKGRKIFGQLAKKPGGPPELCEAR
jgi:ribonucleotide reductase alpha subunit